ncbi:hypothetical protein GH5_01142 [Leishmania sp. Ghana 2012 LV757]|uniref:hypothetical protein n=1 Tax=Leishmania sp. Ghana 2012 LV757 TaxID=2803181 RepID=UPI001B50769E|nr:hypothetical protein GH5_01142 [Leishmania sp. Ghana 2012 LV757]
MSVRDESTARAADASAKVSATEATSGLMDAATAAYVRRHHLDLITRSVAQALCDMEEDQLRHPPLSKTGGPAPPGATTGSVDTTLPLQLLLSSFIILSPSPSPRGVSKSSSKATSSLPLAQDAAGDQGSGVAASPSADSDMRDCFWPLNAAFATKEDAAKAKVCRCIALHCERFLTGLGLVESFGGHLRWAHVAPGSDGGNERLGVALALDVFRCWQQVVIPLLQRFGGSASKGLAAGTANVGALFDCLVKGPAVSATNPAASSPSALGLVCEEAAYWCFALLRGYCQDFPEAVWASILRAAQDAALQQGGSGAAVLPPLTSEALLLRSFIAHLSCSEAGAACDTSAAALAPPKYNDIIVFHMSAAVTAARVRAEAWVWAEVELLQQASADAAVLDSSLSALLCADAYWAVLMQPYTAMLAQYFMGIHPLSDSMTGTGGFSKGR